jgi:type III secretion protein J
VPQEWLWAGGIAGAAALAAALAYLARRFGAALKGMGTRLRGRTGGAAT